MENLLTRLELTNIQDYSFERELGGGKASASAIYINNKTSDKIVVKFLIYPRNEFELKKFQEEAKALEAVARSQQHLEGASSVPLLRVPFTQKENFKVFFFGMEYIKGITLQEYIEKRPLPWNVQDSVSLLLRLSASLYNLGHGSYVHRDIHPRNLLVVNEGNIHYSDINRKFDFSETGIKVLDFGSSRNIMDDYFGIQEDDSFRIPGAVTSFSPELFHNPAKVYTAHDTFAIGTIFYRLLTGEYPANFNCIGDVIQAFSKDQFELEHLNKANLPHIVKLLVKAMLHFDAAKRLSMVQVRDICTDILFSNIDKYNDEEIDVYMNNGGSLYECLHCHTIVSGLDNRCTSCGIHITDDNIMPVLRYKHDTSYPERRLTSSII